MEISIISDPLPESVRAVIGHAAETAYPAETCGVLLGSPEDVFIEKACQMKNQLPAGDDGKHFRMDPLELYRVEREAEKKQLSVIGFYHSHPDCAVLLSDEDKEYMIPGMLYLVVSLYDGRCHEWRCYRKS